MIYSFNYFWATRLLSNDYPSAKTKDFKGLISLKVLENLIKLRALKQASPNPAHAQLNDLFAISGYQGQQIAFPI